MIMMTQADEIMEYIDRFGSITSKEAYDDLGITQLGARVWELKRKGVEFTELWTSGKNRKGKEVRFIRYMFKEG